MENRNTNRALVPVPADAAQTMALARRIAPQFPRDCSAEQALEVARVALAYGLDPFLGELIPFQGKPYITFDGRVRIAEQHAAFDGYEHGPVLGEELTAMRPKGDEAIWKCTVYRTDRSHPVTAYGRAGGPNERNPLAKADPVTLAQKRAIHRALRAAFPVPIPDLEPSITPGQIKAIHALDREQGVGDAERRAELAATFGVASSAELSAAQAGAYLDTRQGLDTAFRPQTNNAESNPDAGAAFQPMDAEFREASEPAAPADKRAALYDHARSAGVPPVALEGQALHAFGADAAPETWTLAQMRDLWAWVNDQVRQRRAAEEARKGKTKPAGASPAPAPSEPATTYTSEADMAEFDGIDEEPANG